ncbi:hypothetical protein ACVXHB_02800 [Escherichia coli]
MATAPDAARAPYPAYGWASFSHCQSDKIRKHRINIWALGLATAPDAGASALSGLRFNASKNGEYTRL